MSGKRHHHHDDPKLNTIRCPTPIIIDDDSTPPPTKKICIDKSDDAIVAEEKEVEKEIIEEDLAKRIQNALNLISEWGSYNTMEGKQAVLDQTVRLLCGGLHTSRIKGYNTQTRAYKEWVEAQNARGEWEIGCLG